MQSNAAVKFAPAVSNDRRIDLAIEGDETVVQLATWTDGLGWCTQKTLRLDPAMLDEMHRMITAARSKVKNRKMDSGETATMSNVLAFPKFS